MKIDTIKSIHDPGGAGGTSIFLGLGSNLGDREANLHLAIDRIALLGLRLTQASSIYESEPVGYADQPWFLNQVIEMEPEHTLIVEPERNAPTKPTRDASTSMGKADTLLRALLRVETDMGRERSIPNGPRVIDVDLLLFGELVVDCETTLEVEAAASRIVVPHPRMHLRRFVLEPLCEIAPELEHPVLKKSYRQLLAELEDRSVVRLHI